MMFKFLRDITYLYQSRDALWNELFKLQQTSKRRDKEYRSRIHYLERNVKILESRLLTGYYDVKSRGKNDPLETNQAETYSQSQEGSGPLSDSPGNDHIWQVRSANH